MAVPFAGACGAWLDQHLHLGITTWLGICRGGSGNWLTTLDWQLRLLPWTWVSMLLAMLALTARAALSAQPRIAARQTLDVHCGCVVATLAMPWLCPLLIGRQTDPARAAVGMLLIDLLIVITVAALLNRFSTHPRPLKFHPSAP